VAVLLAELGFFRAKFHSKSLYSVEKKIVGISQYAYFSTTFSRLKIVFVGQTLLHNSLGNCISPILYHYNNPELPRGAPNHEPQPRYTRFTEMSAFTSTRSVSHKRIQFYTQVIYSNCNVCIAIVLCRSLLHSAIGYIDIAIRVDELGIKKLLLYIMVFTILQYMSKYDILLKGTKSI
jgi:hypothetical protein